MATKNAINCDTAGQVRYDGAGTFTSDTLTQHAVQVGGASNALTSLSVGDTGTVLAGSTGANPSFTATPTVTSITISNAPVSGTDGTNKTYVDAAIAAVNPATSVVAATTATLTVTYANGVSGIGATLTNAGTQAAFSIDGQSPALLSRVLIKDQSSTFQNGVYTVTVVGTGATNWVLTRALDYDQPSDINNTGIINVLNGTVNAGTGWLINSSVTTIGTDAITYTQFTFSTPYTVSIGGTGRTTLTNHGVLVGAGTSAITQLGVGGNNTVLQGTASSDPAFTATPTVTSITFGSGTALSTYAEGTFTPTMTGVTSAGTTTYTIQSGSYVKIGKMVFYTLGIVWTGATGTGVMQIGGFPFAINVPSSVNPSAFDGAIYTNCVVGSSSTQFYCQAPFNGTLVKLFGFVPSTGASVNTSLAANTNNFFNMSGTYLATT